MIRRLLFALITSILAFGGVMAASPAFAATCTTSAPNGVCGPYDYSAFPQSNGFDTYVTNQSVGPQSGSVNNLTATDPGNWSVVANELPLGYGGVQFGIDSFQQFNDWNGNGWGGTNGTQDTPLASLANLKWNYSETTDRGPNTIAEFAADVWDSNYNSDVMFWTDTQGRCNTGSYGGTILGTAVIDGQTWTVNRYGGPGAEIIFVLDAVPYAPNSCAQQTSGSINILAGEQWLLDHGYVSSLGRLSLINTGWEMCSADHATFTVSSMSITSDVGTQQNPPPVPSGLSTTAIGQHAATANWASEPQATSFHLQLIRNSTGKVVRDRHPAAGATSWHFTNLARNAAYHWRISAADSAGTSAFSANQSFRTLP